MYKFFSLLINQIFLNLMNSLEFLRLDTQDPEARMM